MSEALNLHSTYLFKHLIHSETKQVTVFMNDSHSIIHSFIHSVTKLETRNSSDVALIPTIFISVKKIQIIWIRLTRVMAILNKIQKTME